MKINEIVPVFIKHIPNDKEEGILYISEEFGVCIHLCACGCKQQTVIPFNKDNMTKEWNLVNINGKISLTPSIGNFSGENPYHAHYYITENKIVWC